MKSDATRRLLVVADSDSYLKWGAALASTLPAERWRAELVVIETPTAPSGRQIAAALAGTRFGPADVATVEFGTIGDLLDRFAPDAVLLALRGPFVRVVAPGILRRENRPVVLSGFPGLTIPVVRKAIVYREQTDLVVLHSRREVREFTELAGALGLRASFGLATLPFLRVRGGLKGAGPTTSDVSAGTGGTGLDIVFAAQAKVPAELDDRLRLLGWLAEHARRHPEHRVVVKVRAREGEAQTHAERYDYGELVEQLRRSDAPPPANLVVEDGPMAAHLRRAGALVTVSSTAAIEAVAAGVPVLLVDEFGITPELINTVFIGSGLFGSADDLIAGRWHRVDTSWRRDNYFHGGDADDWSQRLEELVAARDVAPLPLLPRTRDRAGGALRAAYDRRRMLGRFDRSFTGRAAMAVGVPARWLVRRVRRMLRGAGERPPGVRSPAGPPPVRSSVDRSSLDRSAAGRSSVGRGGVLGDVSQVGVGVAEQGSPLIVGQLAADLPRDPGDE